MGVHERNLQLKQDIASSIPDFEAKATKAWSEILEKLETVTNEIIAGGSDYLPSVDHADLNRLSSDQLALLKQRGSFIVRNVVPRDGARAWKSGLEDFVRANPNAEGTPVDNPQYFQLFYTKPQLQARAHPNVLATETWCNNLWAGAESTPPSEQLDLNTPLTYVDRFRIRQPGFAWSAHPPHMDGGSIERWLDPGYRSVFEKVLDGRWAEYDPYFLKGRLGARSSAAGLPNQASVFRTFQGWLALSESGPQGGTLQVFPDIALGTAYIMLRPFFTPTAADGVAEVNGVADWTFDLSSSDFPGISQDASAGSSGGARPFELSTNTHPHLRLDKTMISVPTVQPGDMVFWHCDVVHAVEKEHNGKGDSSVMYIPAMPSCAQNVDYVARQRHNFELGQPPPDFPQGRTELDYKLIGRPEDITGNAARASMGLRA